ncbi:hypothetical protein HMPREF1562_1762 [Providencia alcalifaciens F90-2004]|nr:hypothetical protein HMPREF1562_1762 [Providencia alcalifaciens F90-2004]
MSKATALPDTLKKQYQLFLEKKLAYNEAKKAVEQKEYDVQLIKQRKTELIDSTQQHDETWRKLFHENNGVITDEMKQLRTDSVLSKETLSEFDKLISTHQEELSPLENQLGQCARALINQQGSLINAYSRYLFDKFVLTHGKELNSIMKICYLSFKVNESSNAGNSGVYEGINDAKVNFNNFIQDELISYWHSDISQSEINALSKEINFSVDSEVYFDKNLKSNLWEQRKKQHSNKQTKVI